MLGWCSLKLLLNTINVTGAGLQGSGLGSPGQALCLVLVPVGVEQEAHGAGQVRGRVAGGRGQGAQGPRPEQAQTQVISVEEGVGDDGDLEDNKNHNTCNKTMNEDLRFWPMGTTERLAVLIAISEFFF